MQDLIESCGSRVRDPLEVLSLRHHKFLCDQVV